MTADKIKRADEAAVAPAITQAAFDPALAFAKELQEQIEDFDSFDRVNENLLIVFVPDVHAIPIERDKILDRCRRDWDNPDRVFRHLVADRDRPIGRRPLVGAKV